MTDAPLSRDEQKARTRDRLLDAAAEVFADKGFRGASIDAIAHHAGFTKGAVYAHFADKSELFLAVVDRRLDNDFRAGDPMAAESVTDGDLYEPRWTMLALEALLYAYREDPTMMAGFAQRYQVVDEELGRHLTATGRVAPEDTQELALIHSALHEGLMLRRLIDPDRISALDAFRAHERAFGALVGNDDSDDS